MNDGTPEKSYAMCSMCCARVLDDCEQSLAGLEISIIKLMT